MAVYEFVAYQGSSALGVISALDRKLDLYLDRPSYIQFKVNGLHPTALFVEELSTDVVVFRDREKIGRFVMTSVRDEIDATSHYVTVNAVDYRGRLARRIIKTQQTFSAQPDVDIAWSVINTAQGETNGDMGITRGVYPAGVNLTGGFAPGVNAEEAIDILANIDDGFDWDIDADLQFNIYRPRGESKQRVIDYGGLENTASRNFAVERFANVVRVSGDDTITPVVEGTGSADLGRWETEVGYPAVDSQTLLDGLAIDALARAGEDAYAYSVTIRDSEGVQRWNGPSDIGLGDTVRLVLKSGRLDINELKRVTEIHLDVDDDGGEEVTFTLDGVEVTFSERIQQVLDRLKDLERR